MHIFNPFKCHSGRLFFFSVGVERTYWFRFRIRRSGRLRVGMLDEALLDAMGDWDWIVT